MSDLPSLKQSILRSVTGLVLFALITAGAVSLTRLLTAERIEENRQLAAARLLHELAPPDQYRMNLQQPLLLPPVAALGHTRPVALQVAFQNGQPAMVLLPVVAPDGYTGRIELLVALRLDGQVQGVRVIEHRETPGLGDKIEAAKSDWIFSFNGRSLNNPDIAGWTVRRDGGEFDQFTGATITPRAVVHAVRRSLEWLQDDTELLALLNEYAAALPVEEPTP
ncbi:electron transport complex subunit RsxG [Marinospirillum alkaliphilum]|uniref:Ion-translocating oxidoreductase complex subunit G n=1 Tax=Marinospirillum alkaliphilum DSM 21637 TaxID=1122209 RepID=A0A1K1UBC1_9GAMM|nr:electron transport complex subunit RsxG [Marinospirillum alkaliphilum]SFX10122.1 electron transport complex protein RnfG [Marinospirillum alkaliphilum DSM 21637]